MSSAASSPLVSVIVPAYDAERFIDDALASIAAQTRAPDEVIVVDDGSTDGTRERVRAHPTVALRCMAENRGQAAALNAGIEQSSGGVLAFLDADDLWMPDKLAHQLAALGADPSLDGVYGLARERVLPGVTEGAGRDGRVLPAQLPSALVVRRGALRRVGPFDERLRIGCGVDWYGRALDAGLCMSVLPEVVYERRIHGKNLGISQVGDRRRQYLSLVRARLERRRAESERGSG